MDSKFISMLQRRIASTSVGASTARGMGPKGTVAAARTYLAQLDLTQVGSLVEEEFKGWLNQATLAFLDWLPLGAKRWGAARKFLNIFLREVFYNRFLCEAFDLYHIESWLEVPLDSFVASALREEPGGLALPRWKSVIGLDESASTRYQEFAAQIALKKQRARVHLDVLYWRREFVRGNSSREQT